MQYWPSDTNPIKYGDIQAAISNEICYENFNVMEMKLQKVRSVGRLALSS